MSSRRLLKAAEAIRSVVSMAILTELKDPRVKNVTVTYVEVAPDMRSAKVHVSIMGTETQQSLTLRGLQNAAGFLQHRLSDRIDTRYTPRLQFVIDEGVKKSIAISEILRDVLPPVSVTAAEQTDESRNDSDEEFAEEFSEDELPTDESDDETADEKETTDDDSADQEDSPASDASDRGV